MKILIQTGMNLPEVTDEELAEIHVASAEGEVVVAGSPEAFREHLPDSEVMIGTLDREAFKQAKSLRWLHSTGAGADMHMYPEMVASDVRLTGDKGLVGEHLSDHAFGLLLVLTRQLRRAIEEMPNSWPSRPLMRKEMIELTGARAGIVGLGGVGRAVARKSRAFGMDVIAVDDEDVEKIPEVRELRHMDRFHSLLRECDVVFVCCPLTPKTRDLFDDDAFAEMKPTAYIVNVTRGPIINSDAIVKALREGKIAGAGLDVTPVEPLPADHPLWQFPNVMITPHTAGASQFRARRHVKRFIANLRRYRAGEPFEGQIDKQKGF